LFDALAKGGLEPRVRAVLLAEEGDVGAGPLLQNSRCDLDQLALPFGRTEPTGEDYRLERPGATERVPHHRAAGPPIDLEVGDPRIDDVDSGSRSPGEGRGGRGADRHHLVTASGDRARGSAVEGAIDP
jgi:hypothetical protein